MSSIYFGERVRLRSSASSTKAGKSTIRIELETSDPYALAHIQSQINEIESEQLAAEKAVREAEKPTSRKKSTRLAIAAPLLQIPHFGGDE